MNKAFALLAALSTGLSSGIVIGATDTQGPPAADPAFRIMTEEEVDRHRERMARLSGKAREAYRNAEYEDLRVRAEEQGYALPESRPWQAGSGVAGDQTEPRVAATENRGGAEPRLAAADDSRSTEARVTAADGAGPKATTAPGEAYRATLRQRFERYMEDRERRRAALQPPPSKIARPAGIDQAAAARREHAEQRRTEARAEQAARFEQHQAEIETRRQDQTQRIRERTEQARARAEQRQEELLKLRAEARRSGIEAGRPAPRSLTEDAAADAETAQVSEALAQMREDNAAEREQLRQNTEQRVAREKAELEALRDQRLATEAPPAAVVSGLESPAAKDSEAKLQARMEQRRAEAEAQRRTLRPLPPGGAEADSGPTEATAQAPQAGPEANTGEAKTGQAARTPGPAAGYSRHPVYPVYPAVPYPAYPYYPNPYWQAPR